MTSLNIQEAQGVILGFVALIILIIIIISIRKWGWKAAIFWIIVGIIAFLRISSTILN